MMQLWSVLEALFVHRSLNCNEVTPTQTPSILTMLEVEEGGCFHSGRIITTKQEQPHTDRALNQSTDA